MCTYGITGLKCEKKEYYYVTAQINNKKGEVLDQGIEFRFSLCRVNFFMREKKMEEKELCVHLINISHCYFLENADRILENCNNPIIIDLTAEMEREFSQSTKT